MLLSSLLGCTPTLFACNDDASCDGGACIDTGYCAFPDESCESGLRYGEYSPAELANACVPSADEPEPEPETETSTSSPPDDDPGPVDPTTGNPTTGAAESSTSEGSSGTSTGTPIEDPSCGDGNLDPDEACDDGNTADGDDCNADCQVSGELRWLEELEAASYVAGIAGSGDTLLLAGLAIGTDASYLARFSLDGEVQDERTFDAMQTDDGVRKVAVDGELAVVMGRSGDAGTTMSWVANLDPASLEVTDVSEFWLGRATDVTIHEGAAIVSGGRGPISSFEDQRVVSVPLPVQLGGSTETLFAPPVRGTISEVAVDGIYVAAGISSSTPFTSGTAVAYAGLPFSDLPIFEFEGAFNHAWAQSVACRDGACYLGGFAQVGFALEDPPREARLWRIGDQTWVEGVQGPELHGNEVESLVIASNGDPITGGFLEDPATGTDLWVSRWSPDGEERWRWVHDVTGVTDKIRKLIVHQDRIFIVGQVDDLAVVAEITR